MPVEVQLKSSVKHGLSTGDLARLAGVRPSAVRYYESVGLIDRPARSKGRRAYVQSDVQTLKAIVAGRRLGFSVSELQQLRPLSLTDLRDAAVGRAKSLRVLAETLALQAVQLDQLSNCTCGDLAECGQI